MRQLPRLLLLLLLLFYRRQAGVRNAGNFPEVVEQYVLRRACLAPDDPARNSITIADINAHLDRLAAQDADKKAQVWW